MDALSQVISWFFKISIAYICLTLSWNLAAARDARPWPLNIICKLLVVGGNTFALYSLAIAFAFVLQSDEDTSQDTKYGLANLFASRILEVVDIVWKKAVFHAANSPMIAFTLETLRGTFTTTMFFMCQSFGSIRSVLYSVLPLAPIEQIFNDENDEEMRKAALLLVGVFNIGILVSMYALTKSTKGRLVVISQLSKGLPRIMGITGIFSSWMIPYATSFLDFFRFHSWWARRFNESQTKPMTQVATQTQEAYAQILLSSYDEEQPLVPEPIQSTETETHLQDNPASPSPQSPSNKLSVTRIEDLVEQIQSERDEIQMELFSLKATQGKRLADQNAELEKLRRQLGTAHATKDRLIVKLDEEREEAKEALKQRHLAHWTERGELLERLKCERAEHEENCERLRVELEGECARLRIRIDELVAQLEEADQRAVSLCAGTDNSGCDDDMFAKDEQAMRIFPLELDLDTHNTNKNVNAYTLQQANILLTEEKAELERKLVNLEQINNNLIRQCSSGDESAIQLRGEIFRMKSVASHLGAQVADIRRLLKQEHAIVLQLTQERTRNTDTLKSLQEKASSAQLELVNKSSALSQELQRLSEKDNEIRNLQSELQTLRRKHIATSSEWVKDQMAARKRREESENALRLVKDELHKEKATSLGLRQDVERMTRKKNESDKLLDDIHLQLRKLEQGHGGLVVQDTFRSVPGVERTVGSVYKDADVREGSAGADYPPLRHSGISTFVLDGSTNQDASDTRHPRDCADPRQQQRGIVAPEHPRILLLPTASFTGFELETQTMDTTGLFA